MQPHLAAGDPVARPQFAQFGPILLASSTAIGQRGWKTQPEGGLIGLGTSPLTGWKMRSASTAGSGTGTAASNAWV